jgi:hypothetical protein
VNGPPRLALTDFQRSRVEHARALAGVPPEALSAGYDVIDPANLAMVNGFAFGVARGTVAELVGIIDDLTGPPPAATVDASGTVVVTGPATLSAGQLAVALGALADAAAYREAEGACAENPADLDAAAEYRDLTAELTGGAS